MTGMMRLKDEEALATLLRTSHLKVAVTTRPGGVIATPPPEEAQIRAKTGKRVKSAIQESLLGQLTLAHSRGEIPAFRCEYHYLDGRDFRADFAWPDLKIGLEVDGAVHRIKGTFKRSFERAYLITMAGYTVLHVGGDEVRSGLAMEWIKNVLQRSKERVV